MVCRGGHSASWSRSQHRDETGTSLRCPRCRRLETCSRCEPIRLRVNDHTNVRLAQVLHRPIDAARL